MVKSEKAEKEGDFRYPVLLENEDGDVFLFGSPNEGTVIYPGESNLHIGSYSDHWDMDGFHEFSGKIILG